MNIDLKNKIYYYHKVIVKTYVNKKDTYSGINLC